MIGRMRRDPVLAVDFANEIAALPFVRWIALDNAIAVRPVTLAAGQGLRGADAVYAAVAEEYGCDARVARQGAPDPPDGVVRTLTPAAALATLPPP